MKSKPAAMSLEDHKDLAKKLNEAKQILNDTVVLYGPKGSIREDNMLCAPIRQIDNAIGYFEDKMFRDHRSELDQLRIDQPDVCNPDLRIYYP